MIRLRPTRDEDLGALSDLFARRFGHPLAAAEWEWKYRRLPGEARSAVAVDAAGRLLAHAGFIALPARWRGGEGLVWQALDWVATTAGGGLRPPLVDLVRWLLEGLPGAADLPWIFSFPSHRLGRLVARVIDSHPLISFTPRSGGLESALDPGRPAGAVGLETSDSCGPWAEAVWRACGVTGVRRSAEFLNWRYHARPGRYYRFYRLRAADGGEGLAVFAFVGSEAGAAELWLPPGSDWSGAPAALAADLAASGVRTWRFWPPPPGGGAEAPLGRLDLAARPAITVVYRNRRGYGDARPDAAVFTYAMGDWDVT